MTHIKGIETGLRLAERRIHLRHLEDLCGMIGRDAQRLPSINDILT